MASDTLQISSSSLDQPVSTSVLSVTETTAAVWRYCCQASLNDLSVSGISSDILTINVTGESCMKYDFQHVAWDITRV